MASSMGKRTPNALKGELKHAQEWLEEQGIVSWFSEQFLPMMQSANARTSNVVRAIAIRPSWFVVSR
jgi:hypothetical protein